MRVLLQRVQEASVSVDGKRVGRIQHGLLLFLGISPADTESDGAWLAQKVAQLRLFPDESGRMTLNLQASGGGALVVSQFTLYASLRKGNRPSFHLAAPPEQARLLYTRWLAQLEEALGQPPACGQFGAHMQVSLINDGPVTLWLDSANRE